MARDGAEKYLMENAVSPDHKVRVDKARFMAMKEAVLAVLPPEAPGITPAELREAIRPILSQEHFPGGEKAGWWMKGVQLDLEFKGIIARGSAKPVKLYKVQAATF
ncbi:hypothetical protein ASD04_00280 [Devosia sp. Root436]|uniref:DUF6958 family protein n=1 Tax=Devosia sp. Root436 TaxID=1736537 RepID=UPI0006F976F6|nr:hypothetical protein [Devosia sp. Root436]KQX42445.1 hypothetical protein ASD04_00280 [Devosia sp. Root436]